MPNRLRPGTTTCPVIPGVRMVAFPTMVRQTMRMTGTSLAGMYILPSRAMATTIFVPPKAKVETTLSAVTQPTNAITRATNNNWLTPNHPCSRLTAKAPPDLTVPSAGGDIAMSTMRRTASPLQAPTPSTAIAIKSHNNDASARG